MKQMKRILALVLMVCTLATFHAPPAMAYSQADFDSANTSAELTVTGAEEGDEFRVWMIVGITYDETANKLTYTYTPAAEDYFLTKKDVSVDTLMSDYYTKNPENLNTLLAGLSQHIHENGNGDGQENSKWKSPWGGIVTADANGQFTVSGGKAGAYYIEAYQSKSVYRPMLVAIVPTPNEAGDGYVFKNASLGAKHSPISIEKKVKLNDSSASFDTSVVAATTKVDPADAHSQVVFQITAAVPNYLSAAPDGNKKMTIVDKLANGLTYVKDGNNVAIAVYGADNPNDTGTLLTADKYTLTSTDDHTMTIDFSENNYANIRPYSYVRVVYKANVNENAVLAAKNGTDINVNRCPVEYTYSCFPYVTANEVVKTVHAHADVLTYGLKLDKFASGDTTKKLANAKFDLYRLAGNGDSETTTLTIDSYVKQVVKLYKDQTIVTDDNGVFSLEGLELGKYYLVETAAPSGYNFDNTPKEVNIVNTTDDGYTVLSIPNQPAQLNLPTTGSTGMVIFTIIGIAVMGAAVVVLVLSSKKKKI